MPFPESNVIHIANLNTSDGLTYCGLRRYAFNGPSRGGYRANSLVKTTPFLGDATCMICKRAATPVTAGQSGSNPPNREDPMPEMPSHPAAAYYERFKHEWNMVNGPKHEHDCGNCAYLGTHVGHHDTDLYWCEQGGRPTPIARHGAYGDYVSGRDFIDRVPLLALAYVRAVKAGLLYTDVLPGLEG